MDKTSRNRFNEIIVVAKNHNLGKLLKATSSDDPADEIDASDLRYALEELGPAFIKLGQLLATRPDMVGNKIADDLKMLRDNTPATPFDEIKDVIEGEIGKPLEET